MGIALARLAEEDPTFKVKTDAETGQTIISGMGELHLDIIVDRMSREFKVDCNVGKPQVAYRETIRKDVKSRGFFKRQSGGRGQYGDCWLELIPQEQGKGYEFENKVVGGAIPKEYIGSVEAGVKEAMETGVLAGFPMVDIKVSYTTVLTMKSTPRKWPSRSLALWASKKVPARQTRFSSNRTRKSKLSFLKNTWATSSATSTPAVVVSKGMEMRSGAEHINAFVPLAEMFGYATDLRSRTQGRGVYTMTFDHYEEVPKNVAEKVISEKG